MDRTILEDSDKTQLNDRDDYFYVTVVTNALDSLETALSFTNRSDELKWKWIAIAMHHALYSYCISALYNGNPDNVLSKGKDDEEFWCKVGDSREWMRSTKVKVGSSPAYRIIWKPLAEAPSQVPFSQIKKLKGKTQSRVIGFWTALARIQDQHYWMGRLSITRALNLSDEQIEKLVWLTQMVRNEFVHFLPKTYLIDVESTRLSCAVALRAVEFLVLESAAITYLKAEWHTRSYLAISGLREALTV